MGKTKKTYSAYGSLHSVLLDAIVIQEGLTSRDYGFRLDPKADARAVNKAATVLEVIGLITRQGNERYLRYHPTPVGRQIAHSDLDQKALICAYFSADRLGATLPNAVEWMKANGVEPSGGVLSWMEATGQVHPNPELASVPEPELTPAPAPAFGPISDTDQLIIYLDQLLDHLEAPATLPREMRIAWALGCTHSDGS